MAAEVAEVQGEVFVVAVAARQDADAAIVRDGQLLDLVVDPLRFFGETHGALEDDGQAVLGADRVDAVRVERRDALREIAAQPPV